MIKYPENYALGQAKVKAFSKVQFDKITEIIDALNALIDGSIDTDDLTITNTLTVQGASTLDSLDVTEGIGIDSDTAFAGIYMKNAQDTRTGAGAISISTYYTELVTTAANALTLADGTYKGQLKKIKMITDGGDGTLTANLNGYTTITFDAVNDSILLIWDGTVWRIMENVGCTIA